MLTATLIPSDTTHSFDSEYSTTRGGIDDCVRAFGPNETVAPLDSAPPTQLVNHHSPTPPQTPPQLPPKIGDYELLRRVGPIHQGFLVEARGSDGVEYSMRLLHPRLALIRDVLVRFYDEAKKSMLFQHAGIQSVWEVGESSGYHYAVTERSRSHSLLALTQQGRISPRDAVHVARQVVEALHVIHSSNVVHGALHAGNVLLGPNRHVKLTGMTSYLTCLMPRDRNLNATQIRLINAVAPEHIRDSSDVSKSSEIYAVGVLLYQSIMGCQPFPGDTVEQILGRKQTDRFSNERELSVRAGVRLSRLIQQTAASNLSFRVASLEHLHGELTRIAAEFV